MNSRKIRARQPVASTKESRFHGVDALEISHLNERRQKILEGAMRAFLSGGYAVSMDTIAAEAGVAKQTLYSYFKDKESLFSALMDRALDRFVSAGMTHEILSLEPAQLFRTIAQVTLSRMDDWEYVSLLRLVIGESARFPELGELYLSKLVKPGTQKLADYIKSHEQFRFADPEATARLLHGSLIHFIVVQEILGGKHSVPLSRDRLTNALLDLVMFAAEGSKHAR